MVDYRNHTLSEPKETQRWLLEPNAFLLVAADGTIVSVVRARYAGMAAR
ncbi:RcnB family protein [Paracoccus sp. PAR01]|nr:RcnB family protein [Paracoccus sp. PAR01]